MVDLKKHITHWHTGAFEDLEVACSLMEQGKIRHSLFFAHLALEKMLKAHYCRTQSEIAPMIHNLLRLADKAGILLKDKDRDLLAECNAFNIEGRYPELFLPLPSRSEADRYIADIKELIECLNQMF
ncbi:HEPN domain-containing protein [Chrysiogenes arsenatis]|uniref:HEPN domain-containing protein n=1 Tax=Chrysiogenes arsenatis TaxID=309797 RepID=UPI0004179E00|nr:HEPN domain-containing protein [Chrysiogenes arsenatis]